MNKTLRELFLDRVILVEAVQRERMVVTEEDLEFFFDHSRLWFL